MNYYPDPSWIGSDGLDYRNEDDALDSDRAALNDIQDLVHAFTKVGVPTVPAELIQKILDEVL